MKHALLIAVVALASSVGAMATLRPAHAVECANGIYRAGCAGPNGAAVVRKPASSAVPYKAPATVTCARGVYRAGCAGPNGAAVVR